MSIGGVKSKAAIVAGDLDLGQAHYGLGDGDRLDGDRVGVGVAPNVDDGDRLLGKELALVDGRDQRLDGWGEHYDDGPSAVNLHKGRVGLEDVGASGGDEWKRVQPRQHLPTDRWAHEGTDPLAGCSSLVEIGL